MEASTGTGPQSHPFTCNSCQVAFRSSDAQRSHMRSDWHRYNLKRRVASLPPLSSEVYNEKVLNAQATTKAAAERATFERVCTACQKTYFSENAYQNHIGSQKHKLKAATQQRGANDETGSVTGSMISSAFSLGEPISVKSAESDPDYETVVSGLKQASLQEKDSSSRRPSKSTTVSTNGTSSDRPVEDLPLSRCLFCNYDSPTVPLSVLHMSKFHGLFVPEQKYLADLEGLLKYLQAKIHLNNECLYCHKLKGTATGIQTHMRDKGHCMIAFEEEGEMIEIGQFYDFSSTYSDDEDDVDSDDTTTEGGAKVRDGAAGEDDGWETDSSASSIDSDEISAVPIDDRSHQYSKLSSHRHHSRNDPRPHKNADGFHSHAHSHSHAAFYDGYELHLPTGRTAGHRQFKNYFRQNLRDYPTPEEREQKLLEAASDDDSDEEMADADDVASRNTSRNEGRRDANGALITRANAGMLGASDSQKRGVKQAEKRDRKSELRARNRVQARVEKQNNSQKHFRVSLPRLSYMCVSQILTFEIGPSSPVNTSWFIHAFELGVSRALRIDTVSPHCMAHE